MTGERQTCPVCGTTCRVGWSGQGQVAYDCYEPVESEEIAALRAENRRLLVLAAKGEGEITIRQLGDYWGIPWNTVQAWPQYSQQVRDYARRGRALVEGKRDE